MAGASPEVARRTARSISRRGSSRPRRQPVRDLRADLVANPAERAETLVLGPGRLGRILEAPVEPSGATREHGAPLAGDVADGDHVVPRLAQKRVNGLRAVGADVDPDLLHHPEREGVDARRLGPGARHLNTITGQVAEEALRHLTPG